MRKILLPIKPLYAERILSGIKKVEYRKQNISHKGVCQILIYVSYPVCRVVGEFKISGVLCDTPDRLWDKTAHVGGISKADYFAYFLGSSKAYAFQVQDVVIFERPRNIADYGLRHAPQNFVYVEE